MTVTDDPTDDSADTTAPPVTDETSSELLFGPGQSAWLAVVTVVAVVALAVSFVALVMASNDEGGGTAAPAGPATELSIVTSEFAFDPANVTIVADTDVPVTLENSGSIEHNWNVLALGEEIGSESEFDESLVEAAIGPVDAGATDTGSVNLAAGNYQVICTIAGHFDAGMEGDLVVGA